MDKVKPDEYKDGLRLFNPTKPHGTIYSDAPGEGAPPMEARWEQDGIQYRADRTPINPPAGSKRKPLGAEHASGEH